MTNYKQLANKGIFQCPDCKAKLIVKYGEERGLYFSHLHSETCKESKQYNNALTRYQKQNERETKKHRTIVDIIYDELKAQSRINHHLFVEFGPRAKPDSKVIPDILLKIEHKVIAISIITNVNPNKDESLAREIIKRHNYFEQNNMYPIWFIERKELAIEKEKTSIVLWEAEYKIAAHTSEDREWNSLIRKLHPTINFFKLYNYPIENRLNKLETGSLYYIYEEKEKLIVNIKRFLKDRTYRPYRAFLLHEGYSLPLADALSISSENKLLLSNPNQEISNRKKFLTNHLELQKLEEQRLKKVREKEEKKKALQLIKKESNNHLDLTSSSTMKSSSRNKSISTKKKSTLTDKLLYELLRVRIKLNLHERNLLQDYLESTNIEPIEIWELVEIHKCKSYNHLEKLLNSK
ncbi:competence protein CoiA-like family [Bacillus sp. NTK071]|uniref:competence protein CoiA family protein n=1 Tax=Bacillus sp. NTK071 TaxID=2802175 RepID=UPI001A8C9E2A|nr:competence protein CoiA-like family [Bacillus sp. NTK071]